MTTSIHIALHRWKQIVDMKWISGLTIKVLITWTTLLCTMFYILMINYAHNKQTAPRFSKCRHITTTTSNLRNVMGDLEIIVTYASLEMLNIYV